MSSPYDLVTKHLSGLSTPNPMYDDPHPETVNQANTLYNKYNATVDESDSEESVYDKTDLMNKVVSNSELYITPTLQEQNPTKYTLDDLEKDDEFTLRAERFLTSIGSGDDIFEYLRDSNFSPSAALLRASQAKDWSQQNKEDYNYLRNKFDNASVGGAFQVAKLLKDSFIDVLTDPINILALPLIVVSGGVGGIALGAAGRLSASTALKNASTRFAQSNLMKGASIGMTEGAMDGALIGTGNQLTDIETNLRQSIDASDILKQTAIGGSLGAAFGLLGGGAANFLSNRRIRKATDEFELNEKTTNDLKGETDPDIVENTNEINTFWSTVVGSTVGKPTTPLKPIIEASETLEKFLKYIRYDALRDIFDGGTVEKVVESWGLASNRRGAAYYTEFKKALQGLKRKGFFKLELEAKTKRQLRLLMNEPNRKVDLDGSEIGDDIVDASRKLRTVFNQIRKDGGRIEDLDGNVLDEVLFSPGQFVKNYFPRHWIWENVKGKQSILKQLIIKAGHADPLDDIKPVKGVTATGKHIDVVLEEQVSKDQDIFGSILGTRRSFLDLAKEKLGNQTTYTGTDGVKYTGEAAIKRRAQELKADAIVQNMIDRKTTPFLVRDMKAGEKVSAMQNRPFGNISDEDLLKYGFIDDDVESILYNYAMNAGQNIEKVRYFGRGIEQFNERFIEPIRQELLQAGISDNQITKTLERTIELYKRTTGQDVPIFKNKYMRNAADFLKLTQQLAHLPFATISSLTEPLIVLSRADLADTPAIVKSYTKAGSMQVKKNFATFLDRMSALRGKEVRGLRALDNEDYIEAYKASIALEQSAADRIQAMYGEAMGDNWMRKTSNLFFNINILQPWTETVQLAAFNIGKERTARIAKELATGKDMFGRKLSKNKIKKREEMLAEIGVDRNNAVNTYNRSLDQNGILNEEKWKESNFYNQEIIPSSNLFAREIILNPAVAEANKPLLFSTPSAQLLIQFAGYPTAFNNVVLKQMLREMYRYPVTGGARVMAATTLMTGVASITNAIRSRGASLEEDYEGEIIVEAVRRWGGLGPVEYPYRFAQGYKYGGGQAGALLKAPTGPLVGDVVDAIAYRHTGPEMIVQNFPGYSALSPETRKELRAWARGTEPKEPKRRVPRTPLESGGRVGFAEGNIVKVKTEKELYRYLTKNQNVHELDDPNPIIPYKEADVKDFKDKKVYYTSLKENTNIARLRAYRSTKDIGMKVSTNKETLTNSVKLKGRINIKRPLQLSVKELTPEVVLNNLDVIKKNTVIKDKDIVNALINDLKYQIQIRDYALNQDHEATPVEVEIINRSKGYVVRDALIKLGFDSIEYLPKVNEKAFVLLKENQFYPTEITQTKLKDKLSKRRQANLGGLISYIIEKGDTLSSIAKRNKISVAEIMKLNPQIKDADKIYAGEKLNLKPLTEKIAKKTIAKRKDYDSKEFSVFRDVLGFVPLNIKQLFYDVAGGEDTITEADLNKRELAALKDVVKRVSNPKSSFYNKESANRIQYKDYATEDKPYTDVGYNKIGIEKAVQKLKDPYYSLKTTLGQASITQDKLGNTIIKDRYNFNDNDGQTTLAELYSDMKAIYHNPLYMLPRKIGKYFGSKEGEGSFIEINLGKLYD